MLASFTLAPGHCCPASCLRTGVIPAYEGDWAALPQQGLVTFSLLLHYFSSYSPYAPPLALEQVSSNL